MWAVNSELGLVGGGYSTVELRNEPCFELGVGARWWPGGGVREAGGVYYLPGVGPEPGEDVACGAECCLP